MIELADVHKSYIDKKGRTVHALRGISYKFPNKGLVFILGKSGSGKSTMLNMLGLLDKYDEGELLIDGKPSNEFTERERDTYRALNIGFVFQEFHIIDKFTIGKNVSLALEIGQQVPNPEQVSEALTKVGLAGFDNRFARGVSGGQKQRVAIARAIIKNPKVILADEPTGSLDSVTSREIFELLQNLAKDNLVIVISHDMESAHRYADEIVELADGQIIGIYHGDGTTDTVRMSVNQVDTKNSQEINSLIQDGKKVVLFKEATPKPLHQATEEVTPIDLDRRVKLPFKSSLKLSLLSMRAKWVRLFFTVFLSMFAIAFFGFSDMVGQFSVNRIMTEEMRRVGLPWANIALMEVDESTFIDYRTRTHMTSEHVNLFQTLGIEDFGVQYVFPVPIRPQLISYTNFFPGRGAGSGFFNNSIHGAIEMENPEVFGLELAYGRWPENTNEVIITNYMLERYKMFGMLAINDDAWNAVTNWNAVTLTQLIEPLWGEHTENSGLYVFDENTSTVIESFECIEGRAIVQNPQAFNVGFNRELIRIVGMVEFDLDRFEHISSQMEIVLPNQITQQQRDLLRRANSARQTHLNNFFTLPGFANELMRRNNIAHLTDQVLTEATFTHTDFAGLPPRPLMTGAQMHNFDTATVLWCPDQTREDYNQVIVSGNMLWNLLPQSIYNARQDEVSLLIAGGMSRPDAMTQVTEEMVLNDGILDGATLDFAVNRTVAGIRFESEVTGFEIVGIHMYWGRAGFITTQDFFDQMVFKPIGLLIVPAQTNSERNNLMNLLYNQGRFVVNMYGEDVVLRFTVWSENAQEIYFLDTMFNLFTSVFSLAAIALCIFAILLMYTFISSSIKARMKDIGILRSLGAGRGDIARIFTKEGLILIVFTTIAATLACLLLYFFLNLFFISQLGYIAQTYTLVSFGIRQVLLMGLIAVIGITISTAWPIIRIARKQPVEAIREVQ